MENSKKCLLDCLAKTPVNSKELNHYLKHYPKREEAMILEKGFKKGFSIPFEGSREGFMAKNHSSVNNNPSIVRKKLEEEIKEGRVAGPFESIPMPNLRVSPMGLVPKSTPGDYRLIFDLSFPHGSSINDGIPDGQSSVTYTHFDEVTRMVRELGKDCFLVKVDIKSAFRLLPINPEDFSLLGMFFEGHYYVDKSLPFGLSISCALFERFSTFLEWVLKGVTGNPYIIHYLDDFCGAMHDKQQAVAFRDKILKTFLELGVPVAEEKIEGPVTELKFLGLIVDTHRMEVRLPMDKIEDLMSSIEAIMHSRKSVSLKQLQSLIGKMNFACRAVQPGRAFCRRLINATMGAVKPFHKVRVTQDLREDLKIWKAFLRGFNGVSVILPDWELNDHVDMHTDAAGTIGYGAYLQGHWTAGAWPDWVLQGDYSITFKELVPIVLTVFLWGHILANKKVLIYCDNEAVVHCINNQTSKSKPVLQLIRRFVLKCLRTNIVFQARHMPGQLNSIADSLSRLQWERFRRLAPGADSHLTPVPSTIWQELAGRSGN